jgi:hypothetical protein
LADARRLGQSLSNSLDAHISTVGTLLAVAAAVEGQRPGLIVGNQKKAGLSLGMLPFVEAEEVCPVRICSGEDLAVNPGK